MDGTKVPKTAVSNQPSAVSFQSPAKLGRMQGKRGLRQSLGPNVKNSELKAEG